MKGMVTTRGMGVSSPSAGASTSLGRKGRPAVRRRVSQRPAKETNMKKKTQGEPEEERRTLNALGPSGEEVTAEGIEVKKTDLQLHPVFPFMAPVLLWRMMSFAGFFVYIACTLMPPNPFTGGSQLNAALTLFQSVLLWKAPTTFRHDAKRTLTLSCFLGYSVSAGVTLSDMIFSRTLIRFLLWSGSFLMFYLAAQANMCYLILDNQTHALRMGVLEDTFHLEDFTHESRKERRRKMSNLASALPPWRIVIRAFSRVLGLTVLSFLTCMLGKVVHETFTLAMLKS